MGRHHTPNEQQNDKPWEHTFEEESDVKQQEYSRIARNTRRKSSLPLANVLLAVFALLIVIPIGYMSIFYHFGSNNTPTGKTAEEVMLQKSISSASSSSSLAVNSNTATSTSSSRSSSSSSVASTSTSSGSSASTASSSSSSSSGTRKITTYVVQSGDNYYRIALSHGMDLDTLLSLNGITDTSSLPVGTELKVYEN